MTETAPTGDPGYPGATTPAGDTDQPTAAPDPAQRQLDALHDAGYRHIVTADCASCGSKVFSATDFPEPRPTATCANCGTTLSTSSMDEHRGRTA